MHTIEEDPKHRYIEQAAALADRAVQFAVPETFGLSTTCSEFDVRTLAEHMFGFARLTAHAAPKTLPDGDRLEIGAGWQGVYRTWIHGPAIPVTSELDAFERALALSGRNPNR